MTTITGILPESASGAVEDILPEEYFRERPLPCFHPVSVDFLNDVSARIMKIPNAVEHPELVALGYWLRKANILSIIKAFQAEIGEAAVTMPRGVAFHSAPSNVDSIFLYSWALSLVCGNLNIIRVSQRSDAQLELLFAVLREALRDERWSQIRSRNAVITYPHDEQVTSYISQRVDARALWGGDATVSAFRAIPGKPFTKDIAFSDRFSFALVGAEGYNAYSAEERAQTARAFYNDSYWFGQMACSSPRIVYFAGAPDDRERASALFWDALTDELKRRGHKDAPSVSMDKFVFLLEKTAGGTLKVIRGLSQTGPVVVRAPMEAGNTFRETCGGGFFFEIMLDKPSDMAPLVRKNDQTMTHSGYTRETMLEFAKDIALNGIDRITPMGDALRFSSVWDGYHLLNEFTRRIYVA